jgi:dinuclear metal center YbgI/SA1388 family protein
MKTEELIAALDTIFQPERFPDPSQNGLQVAGRGETEKVLFAVDASLETIRKAQEEKCGLIIVHHGLFWSRPLMVRGYMKERLKALLQSDIGLYAVHLPLDEHPELGNNMSLALEAGIIKDTALASYKGVPLGILGHYESPRSLEEAALPLKGKYQPLHVIDGGRPIRRAGVITGDAGSLLDEILESGIDLLISGELNHAMVHPFKESGLSGLFYGHYATERGGLLRLKEHLERVFPSLGSLFYDNDTKL